SSSPNWSGVMRSSNMKYSGRTALNDSEEMSVSRLVSPRRTTLRLTIPQRGRVATAAVASVSGAASSPTECTGVDDTGSAQARAHAGPPSRRHILVLRFVLYGV